MTRQEAIIFLCEHGQELLGDNRYTVASSFVGFRDWASAAELIAGDESDDVLNMLADALWEGKQ